jgi:hypothetical protein
MYKFGAYPLEAPYQLHAAPLFVTLVYNYGHKNYLRLSVTGLGILSTKRQAYGQAFSSGALNLGFSGQTFFRVVFRPGCQNRIKIQVTGPVTGFPVEQGLTFPVLKPVRDSVFCI